MPDQLPFEPSIPSYRVGATIDATPYLFDVRWNSRDGAWYLDLLESDETPIVRGVKIVLGVNLARHSTHEFFRSHLLHAIDTSGQGRDATLDDLGTRVIVLVYSYAELAAGRDSL